MGKKQLAKLVRDDIARVAIELGYTPSRTQYLENGGRYPDDILTIAMGSYETACRAAGLDSPGKEERPVEKREPRILLFDLETSGILARVFGTRDQNIGLNQIVEDCHLLSFAAKYLGDPKIFYMDQRNEPVLKDDTKMLKVLSNLLLNTDVVITQNGKSFDEKVLNARITLMGLPAIPKYAHMDTLRMSRGRMKFTSHKLEYMAKALNVECKKLMDRRFIGMDLWNACIANNPEAWAEMKAYNCADVLALEGVYLKLRPWGVPVDLNAFYSDSVYRCQCGANDFERQKDLVPKGAGLFERFRCRACGAWHDAKGADNNYISGTKKASLRSPKASE